MIFLIVGLIILYFVIRMAVHDGMRDAWRRRDSDRDRDRDRGEV